MIDNRFPAPAEAGAPDRHVRPDPGAPATPADPVATTLALLGETAEAVRGLMQQVRDGDFGRLDELVKEQAALRRALGAAIHERQAAERMRREEGGVHADGVIDLEQARAEIGRRLARLRSLADAKEGASKPQR